MRKMLILALVLLSMLAKAQKEPSNSAFEIEVDPIAYVLKGFSVHGIYQYKKMRFDLGVFGIEQPEKFHGNKGFQVYSKGVGLKVTHVFKTDRGFYTGVGFGTYETKFTHLLSQISDRNLSMSLGALVGYRFFLRNRTDALNKGIYLTPWVSFDHIIYAGNIDIPQQEVHLSKYMVFPTVHLGFRF